MINKKSMNGGFMILHRKDKQKKPKKKPGYTDYGITEDEFYRVLNKAIQPVKESKSDLKKSGT